MCLQGGDVIGDVMVPVVDDYSLFSGLAISVSAAKAKSEKRRTVEEEVSDAYLQLQL